MSLRGKLPAPDNSRDFFVEIRERESAPADLKPIEYSPFGGGVDVCPTLHHRIHLFLAKTHFVKQEAYFCQEIFSHKSTKKFFVPLVVLISVITGPMAELEFFQIRVCDFYCDFAVGAVALFVC